MQNDRDTSTYAVVVFLAIIDVFGAFVGSLLCRPQTPVNTLVTRRLVRTATTQSPQETAQISTENHLAS